ncbi:hypothetical protein Tco_1187951, partial [Tanacetum coccineum]
DVDVSEESDPEPPKRKTPSRRVPDSHKHLFFECSFLQQVWNHMKTYAGMDSSVPIFSHILASLISITKRRPVKSVIAKLVVAACAYFIWQERNWRLFKKNKRPMKQIIDCIMNSIRLKLLSCRFKKSNDGVQFSRLWKLPDMRVFKLELEVNVLGKSICKTEAEEVEAVRQVYFTHARIVTKSVPKPTGRRKSSKVTSDPPKRLKGVPSLTLKEQEAADTMQALKEKLSLLPEVKELSEYSEEVYLDDEEKDDKDGDTDDEGDDHINDTQDDDDEDAKTESDVDEIYKYKIHVRKDVDSKMAEPETVEHEYKEKDVLTDVAKHDVKKNAEEEGDAEKAIQSPSVQKVPVSVIPETTNLLPIPEILTETLVSTTISSPHLRVAKLEKDVSELKKIDLFAEALATLKKKVPYIIDNYLGSKVGDVFQKELKKHMANLIQTYSLQQIPELLKNHTLTFDLEQESKKSSSEILKIKKEQAKKQKMLKFTIKSTDKATLKEFDQKSGLYWTMHAKKSFNRNPANHRLYHALMEALIEDENAMDKGVADTIKDYKRKHDDDEDPLDGPNQGKAPAKGYKICKSASAKEPIEEPTAEVVMDDAGEDVVRDDDQPQDNSEPKTAKTLNPEWFTQPPRPLILDLE